MHSFLVVIYLNPPQVLILLRPHLFLSNCHQSNLIATSIATVLIVPVHWTVTATSVLQAIFLWGIQYSSEVIYNPWYLWYFHGIYGIKFYGIYGILFNTMAWYRGIANLWGSKQGPHMPVTLWNVKLRPNFEHAPSCYTS